MNSLPEHILKLMSPADRASLGPAGMTAAEAGEKWAAGEEKKLHDVFEADMQRRGVLIVKSRMDRKPTIRKGWPDFTLLYRGRCACIEFKAAGGEVSKDQAECIVDLQRAGVPVLVAWNLQSAIDFAKAHLSDTIEIEGVRG